jgi:hypothetical protein
MPFDLPSRSLARLMRQRIVQRSASRGRSGPGAPLETRSPIAAAGRWRVRRRHNSKTSRRFAFIPGGVPGLPASDP